MTEKELKRMSRGELLELLIDQIEENRELKDRLDQVRTELESKQIAIENAGSIAEAALVLNGVFEAADRAVRQYLDNVRNKAVEGDDLR